MTKALLVPAGDVISGGPRITVETVDGLGDYQRLVGGFVEAIYLDDATVLVNEEGLPIGLKENVVVSAYLAAKGAPVGRIVGDALLVGPVVGDQFADVPESILQVLGHLQSGGIG